MVEVAPFRALEYDPARVDLGRAVSPPFDVIGADLLARLRKASPYNFVHITLHPEKKGRKKVDRFAEADRLLETWIQEGFVRPTPEDVLYAYECQYEHRGATRRMRGVIARLRLDATYSSVVPHEQTFPRPADERARLLRATGTDLEPIQLLYSGKSAEAALWAYVDGSQRPPDVLAAGPDGALHKYWRINDAAVIGTVVEGFKGRKTYIADGHHRYAAALLYAQERRSREYRPPKNAPWEYKLSLLVHIHDPGLVILPTHRVVKRAGVRGIASIVKSWSGRFDVRPVDLAAGNPVTHLGEALAAHGGDHVCAGWLGEPHRGYLLESRDKVLPTSVVPDRSHTYRSLGVVFLQTLALTEGLKVPAEKWGDDVAYTRDDEEAVEWVRGKKAVAVLLHQPTRLAQLRAVADGGEKMPQKSTYFLPKTLSGVCWYPIGKPSATPVRPRITS